MLFFCFYHSGTASYILDSNSYTQALPSIVGLVFSFTYIMWFWYISLILNYPIGSPFDLVKNGTSWPRYSSTSLENYTLIFNYKKWKRPICPLTEIFNLSAMYPFNRIPWWSLKGYECIGMACIDICTEKYILTHTYLKNLEVYTQNSYQWLPVKVWHFWGNFHFPFFTLFYWANSHNGHISYGY